MSNTITVCQVDCSVEEDRPFIDFELAENARQDWNIINNVFDGSMTIEGPLPIEILVNSDDALSWDFYMLPGIQGLISERALHLLSPFASAHFDFLQLRLNSAPYFLFHRLCPLDCLDREKSDLLYFPSNPKKVMEIREYAFKPGYIKDPLVFWIPEERGRVFCTASVREMIIAGLRGVRVRAVRTT